MPVARSAIQRQRTLDSCVCVELKPFQGLQSSHENMKVVAERREVRRESGVLRSLDALGGLWWKEVVLMDGPTSSWCTPVLELRLSHACTNHAVLPGEWAELCKRCVEAATRRDEGILD